MFKDANGNTVYNRAELTEDRCRQSKADNLTVSRNLLQDLMNDSTKLNRIRELCDVVINDSNESMILDARTLANRISSIVKEKI